VVEHPPDILVGQVLMDGDYLRSLTVEISLGNAVESFLSLLPREPRAACARTLLKGAQLDLNLRRLITREFDRQLGLH
jgi:hypothetical protein